MKQRHARMLNQVLSVKCTQPIQESELGDDTGCNDTIDEDD